MAEPLAKDIPVENMNIHDDFESELSDGVTVRASETTEPEESADEHPPMKKYKCGFKHKASDRRAYDRKNLKALDKKLKEWYELTKCPTVALSLVGNKIFYSGPSQFQGFAVENAVQRAFSAIVLHRPDNEGGRADIREDVPIQLPQGWRDLDVYSRRKLVIALATNNGTKSPHWRDSSHCPCWWPESIPYADPNNSQPRLTSAHLGKIIAQYNYHLLTSGADGGQQASEEFGVGDAGCAESSCGEGGESDQGGAGDSGCAGGEQRVSGEFGVGDAGCAESSCGEGGESDQGGAGDSGCAGGEQRVSGEFGDAGCAGSSCGEGGESNQGGAGDSGCAGGEQRASEVGESDQGGAGDSGCAGGEGVKRDECDVHDSDHADGEGVTSDSRHASGESGDGFDADDAERSNNKTSSSTSFPQNNCPSDWVAGMKTVLRQCTIYDDEDLEKILGYLKGVDNWRDFVECVSVVAEKVDLTPSYMRSVEDELNTEKHNVEVSVRCDVPKYMLKNAWEPVKVTGDGNCLFRSISRVLTGSEDDHFWFKLAVVAHGPWLRK